MIILKFHTDLVRLYDVKKLFLTRKHLEADTCWLFLPRKYNVISQVRHSYVYAEESFLRGAAHFTSEVRPINRLIIPR